MFTEHLTAFIDILGFRSALRDTQRLERLLALLSSIASTRGEFKIDRVDMENERFMSMRPAISAFSDSIVLSFPTDALHEHEMDLEVTFALMETFIGTIAASCIDAGLLIRGGICLGQLYHSNGIVLGPALVEAYELESTVAYYPRVIVSSALADKFRFSLTARDNDGLHCLSYIKALVFRKTESQSFLSPVASIASVRSIVGENVALLKEGRKTKQLTKWQWFSNQFEAYVSRQDSILSTMANLGNLTYTPLVVRPK